jgi:signal transduction histidine kinase
MPRLMRSKPVATVFCLLLLAVVAWADLATPLNLEFHLFYFVPLLIGAWFVGDFFALLICLLSAAMGYVDAIHNGLTVTPFVYLNAGTRLVAFAIITAAVLALRETNRRLRASETLRENLTSMVVHDLKNPLTSAAMAVTMLRRCVQGASARPTSPEEQEKLLRIVGQSQEELGDLIDELLIIARGESGTAIPLAAAPADVAEVLRAAVQAIGPRAQDSTIELVEDYPPAGLTVTMDARLIRRVVENLLDNALKFTPRGGRVGIAVEAEGEGARVTVRDSGAGIPRHLQKQIFDRYAQATAVRQGARVSIGLGLAFCRLVVEAHGGAIWVDSTPGEGAAFIFTLPARPPQLKAAHNH